MQFLPYMLQFLDNLCRLFIFSNYIGEIPKQITSRWAFWKGSILNTELSEKFLFVDHPKEDNNERQFKPKIIGEILDKPKSPLKQEKHPLWVVHN